MEGEGVDDQTMQELLKQVNQLILSGDGNKAFSLLLHTVRLSHPEGEGGIIGILDKAKEMISRQRRLDNVDEIDNAYALLNQMLEQESLLGESGDSHILRDAFVDGSSVICKKCSSLVKRERWEQHTTRWCSALNIDIDDDEDDS